jgi:hypothetical protein
MMASAYMMAMMADMAAPEQTAIETPSIGF